MIHFIVGTRAQLLKLAPVMRECDRRSLAWRWVYTAQHRETVQELIETFELPPPDHVIVVWRTEAKSRLRMARWLGRMLVALISSRDILAGAVGNSHVVLTHGDTFTTWLGALIGKFTGTPVMHVESGLRSFNLRKPFPEEINRLITFHLADIYACPGEWAVRNLDRYGGVKLDTGANTQVDTLRFGLERLAEKAAAEPTECYVVATIHRYENIFDDDRFTRIVDQLIRISRTLEVRFICHPATALRLERLGLRARLEEAPGLTLLPRLDYLSFLELANGAEFVVTDGGGNQEELAYLGKPTLILRDSTERTEGIGANAVLAPGVDADVIDRFLGEYRTYARPAQLPEHRPSEKIVDFLEEHAFGRLPSAA